jgi:hypothetical protein
LELKVLLLEGANGGHAANAFSRPAALEPSVSACASVRALPCPALRCAVWCAKNVRVMNAEAKNVCVQGICHGAHVQSGGALLIAFSCQRIATRGRGRRLGNLGAVCVSDVLIGAERRNCPYAWP